MNTLDHLAELLSKATPLPWTAECLGGRELGDAGILASLESVPSPFSRATHEDDEAFAVAAINALPVLLEIARAGAVYKASVEAGGRDGFRYISFWIHVNDIEVARATVGQLAEMRRLAELVDVANGRKP